jgi:hypothetical protein
MPGAPGAISALAVLPLKAVAHPDQQPPGGLHLLLRESTFEKRPDERNVGCKNLLKQGMALPR